MHLRSTIYIYYTSYTRAHTKVGVTNCAVKALSSPYALFIVKYSDNQKNRNMKTTLQQYSSVFDGVTQQIVLLDTYKINYIVKWVCLHCTIAVFHGRWTF